MSVAKIFPVSYLFAARAGLIARGAVYLVVAAFLIWAAILPGVDDVGAGAADTFIKLEHTFSGRLLLLFIGVGLFVYAAWRWATALFNANNPQQEQHRALTRIGMMISGTGYAFLGGVAIAVILGANDEGGPDKTEQVARWLLSLPYGQWVLVGAGLIVAGFGLVQFWIIISNQWKENLIVEGWSRKLKPVAFFGVGGRAVLFMLVSIFLVIAGLRGDANEAKGIAEILSWLRGQEYGWLLYLGAGLAIGAYGIFSLIQARCYELE